MVKRLSALKTKCVAGRHGATGHTGVVLGERLLGDLWQISGWSNFATAAAPVLKRLGFGGLGDLRSARNATHNTSGCTVWRIAADKLLIEGGGDLSGDMSADLTTLDLSHARAVLTLTGPAVRDLLAQVIAIDVTPAFFDKGQFLQTGIHHVGVFIYCTGENRFEIFVPVTWAETIWVVLFNNALPHGVEIR